MPPFSHQLPEQKLNKFELSEAIAEQLSKRKVRIERRKFLGDFRYGIHTESMLCLQVHFPLVYTEDLFQVAQSLFPRREGENLSLHGLGANGELHVSVYFPLPYSSAERFAPSERRAFVDNMALFKISTVVKGLLGAHSRNTLAVAIPDPRHPDEIKWENRKSAVVAFFKGLLPKRKKAQNRGFQEYL